jgi:dTMP kinase
MGGLFLVLDGVDGCGKSTQATRLAERLRAQGRTVHHLREPGSTAVGEALRSLLLSVEVQLGPEVETLLFAAARRQLLDECVLPALAAGETVVCERFDSSTYAYQAVAGGLDGDELLALLRTWAVPRAPDLVVLLDLDPELAATRRGGPTDRIEAKGLEFQRRVAEGYRSYADRVGGVVRVDAMGAVDDVSGRIWREVERVL